MMSFLQLATEKSTSFLVGISIKFRPFLFCQSLSTPTRTRSISVLWDLPFYLGVTYRPYVLLGTPQIYRPDHLHRQASVVFGHLHLVYLHHSLENKQIQLVNT